MKKTKVLFCLVLVLMTQFIFAQTQQGFVKTIGRPEKKGEALGGVTVRVKGEHNPVVSNNDGTFSMLLVDKKNGDAYSLQQVQKNGYELNEIDMIGRPLAFSDKVPLTIVMVSSEQLQADKQRIENNAYKTAEKNYKAKCDLLEKQLSDNEITAKQYREELRDLQDKFEKYQLLIDGLAEHYAHTDYDELDEKDREINICIENGDLERADSLIRTLFDPIGVLERSKEALAQLDMQISQTNDIIAQANEDMAAVLKQQEKDAEYLYQLYTIALARYDNEKAQFYIETRAALDTTNVEWQNEAGRFLDKYIADYDKALRYFQLGLRQAVAQFGERSSWGANFYNNIGHAYFDQGNYDKAMEYYNKALAIWKSVLGENHPDIANVYNNIGSVYNDQGDYDKALEYHNKALVIWKSVLGENHRNVATSYNNIGLMYNYQGDYGKALEYHNKALAIWKSVLGENHRDVATSYNNIGTVYFNQRDYGKALEYCNKALAIWESVLGENHPNVALSYNNIGSAYFSQGDYGKALEYLNKAVIIRKSVLGENHPDMAESYDNIGFVYSAQGDYGKALDYVNKALAIQESVLGENHPYVAFSYDNIGFVYSAQGDYGKALEYHNKALAIRKSVLGENHPDAAKSYNNIGTVYFNQGDYGIALEYYNKALAIQESVLGENHRDVATSYDNIGSVYFNQRDYGKALEYYNKALAIRTSVLGENHPDVIKLQNLIMNSEYEQALNNNTIQAFNEVRCCTATIIKGDTPASQQGMSGEYILLEFADWNQDSSTSLFEKNNELRGKPKDILVMKDGHIKQYHFENAIGAQLGVKYVGKEEKQRINKAYEEWKKQNRK